MPFPHQLQPPPPAPAPPNLLNMEQIKLERASTLPPSVPPARVGHGFVCPNSGRRSRTSTRVRPPKTSPAFCRVFIIYDSFLNESGFAIAAANHWFMQPFTSSPFCCCSPQNFWFFWKKVDARISIMGNVKLPVVQSDLIKMFTNISSKQQNSWWRGLASSLICLSAWRRYGGAQGPWWNSSVWLQ